MSESFDTFSKKCEDLSYNNDHKIKYCRILFCNNKNKISDKQCSKRNCPRWYEVKALKINKEKPLKIDYYKKDWAIEFCDILGIEYKPIYQKIISMSMVTALYRIADTFEPDMRKLILKRFNAVHPRRKR